MKLPDNPEGQGSILPFVASKAARLRRRVILAALRAASITPARDFLIIIYEDL
jgi:hypothetical protein